MRQIVAGLQKFALLGRSAACGIAPEFYSFGMWTEAVIAAEAQSRRELRFVRAAELRKSGLRRLGKPIRPLRRHLTRCRSRTRPATLFPTPKPFNGVSIPGRLCRWRL